MGGLFKAGVSLLGRGFKSLISGRGRTVTQLGSQTARTFSDNITTDQQTTSERSETEKLVNNASLTASILRAFPSLIRLVLLFANPAFAIPVIVTGGLIAVFVLITISLNNNPTALLTKPNFYNPATTGVVDGASSESSYSAELDFFIESE